MERRVGFERSAVRRTQAEAHKYLMRASLTHAVLIRFVLRCFRVAPLSRLYLPTSSRLPALFIRSFIFIHDIYPSIRIPVSEFGNLHFHFLTTDHDLLYLYIAPPKGTSDMKDNRMDPLSCHLIYVLLAFISVFRVIPISES